MNTDDLSLELCSTYRIVEHEGAQVLRVTSYGKSTGEMRRKGFKQISRHYWVRPLDYKADPNAYEEN